jgi:aerobic-type carbon monoxide dehydrogenase small subunit (CoxS/CutS family)
MIEIVERFDSDTLFAMMADGKTVETLQWLENNVLK